ncbi:hypothetical protein ABN034_31975 [Actinopolymorpha sp. B11F2]|uniref:hypothetical protein n=1 Tax=Actinopolymorpha sp. B11F2 TaxID=3160862 RepID=UPI0032E50E88
MITAYLNESARSRLDGRVHALAAVIVDPQSLSDRTPCESARPQARGDDLGVKGADVGPQPTHRPATTNPTEPFTWTAAADEILAKVQLVQTDIKKLVDNNAK